MTESSTQETGPNVAAGGVAETADTQRTDDHRDDDTLPGADPEHSAAVATGNDADDPDGSDQETDESDEDSDDEVESTSAGAPLQSLTPHYEKKHHETYLRRLEEALKHPKNRNIALTGRYGAGKSSVLDEFEEKHRKATQRLSISTLAPGSPGDSTTNRIQKEIVKQLLYGAAEKVGRNSRFNRIAVLSKRRALAEALGVVGAVGLILVFFGWLPELDWPDSDADSWMRVAAWCGVAAVAVALVAAVRVMTHGWFISDLGAGGATVTLTSKESSSTFFDKYLDEIVYYFDRESKDIVIFEDLDRFEDSGIFEAVRELNILLNDTPRRRARRRGNWPGRLLRWGLEKLPGDVPGWLTEKLPAKWATRLLGLGIPLRFIYAVKDSMFEKLGDDTKKLASGGDAVAAETLRANRTKFFDLVVPMVPFISHRNARELLLDLLEEAGITGIDRALVGLVSRHTTDMRLLRNMCNEYLVFAERLLEAKKKAPGFEPSKLFALIAYKNFHLSDFENISRRDSDLDRLYEFHQQLVRQSVDANDRRVRGLKAGREQIRTRKGMATRLGDRLTRYAEAERKIAHRRDPNLNFVTFEAGSRQFSADAAATYKFWAVVADAAQLTIFAAHTSEGGNPRQLAAWTRADLEVMVPEALDANGWTEVDSAATHAEQARLASDIEALRSADFKQLAETSTYKLTESKPATGEDSATSRARTFEQLVNATLKSPLAKELVFRGYLDRNFSLYAAQFYGHFSGINVANFMVHHVQANVMNVDYQLSGLNEVKNLLAEAEEAGEPFTDTAAAYNVDVVDYLIAIDHPGAADVIKRLVTIHDEDAETFLRAYLNLGAQREALVAGLVAAGWRVAFEYLATSSDVPIDARPVLVGAALAAAGDSVDYKLPPTVGEFITDNYKKMNEFTSPLEADGVTSVVTMLERAGVRLPDLTDVDSALCGRAVERDRYLITGSNLRTALGVDGAVPLDEVIDDDAVYAYCLAQPGAYLTAVREDSKTEHTVRDADNLLKLLDDVTAKWSEEELDEHLPALLGAAATSARVPKLRQAPPSTWRALATAKLFDATLINVERYRSHAGGIDAALAALLEAAGAITAVDDGGDEEYDPNLAAIAILNNDARFTSTKVRVKLASSLDADYPLPTSDLSAESSDLFARMLTAGLVEDDEVSFEHFRAAGWDTIGPAIKASAGITSFLPAHPELLHGMVDAVFADADTREKLGDLIASNIDAFVPEFDSDALHALAQYADRHSITLSPGTVVQVAPAQPIQADVVLRLLAAAEPAATTPQIMEVFTAIGGNYAKVSRPGTKFNLRDDAVHDKLLAPLKVDNVIKTRRNLTNGEIRVTVL